jgi:hypothetical protein
MASRVKVLIPANISRRLHLLAGWIMMAVGIFLLLKP